jgi:hypothetical protein
MWTRRGWFSVQNNICAWKGQGLELTTHCVCLQHKTKPTSRCGPVCVLNLPVLPPLVLFALRHRISRALSMTRRKVSSTSLAGTLYSASPKPLQPPSHNSGRKYVESAQNGRADSHQPWGVDPSEADGSDNPQISGKLFRSGRPCNLSRRSFQFTISTMCHESLSSQSVLSAFEF